MTELLTEYKTVNLNILPKNTLKDELIFEIDKLLYEVQNHLRTSASTSFVFSSGQEQ